MGLTGAGKSTFIERLTGLDAGIGHDLVSETSRITIYPYLYGNRRIFLVDTPGFDDTRCIDSAIFTDIAFYLGQIYKSCFRLGGILYLHRITDNRVSGSAMRSFQLVQKICGSQGAKFARLVTTMWDEAPEGTSLYSSAVKREMELKSTEGYWGWMKNCGSRTQRCMDTRASALSILSGLLAVSDAQGPVVFQLQQEIIEEHKEFDETAAGIVLNNHYATRWDRLQGELRALQKPLLKSGSLALGSRQEVQEQRQDLERQITAVEVGERHLRQTVESHFADKTKRHRTRFNHTQDEISELSSKIESLKSELESLREVSSRFTQAFDPQSRGSMRTPPEVASFRPRGMSGRRDHRSSSYTYERSSFDDSDGTRGLQHGRPQQRNRLQRMNKPQYSMEVMSSEERKILLERELARQEKRKIMKRNTLAVLGMLGGVATIAAGAATLQIPVVAAGIALFGTAGMKLDLHKKKKKKPEEDREWVVSEHD
ncbi:uncharacterized protein BKA55DRAFT_132862 [Fusarium redolens]|uniref:G domain-containing protein n=1 Tax=Fusarium redolens TaxID=48865 RepID=A0A9P9GFC2_FUSRE|nr:uncharacterized protein BKA55DRAFT_132862 [Fusarium redolens]KAH7236949.1 hypothetical protein BKA55DRAFT_132862 [Fusarium redolens]